MDGCPDTIEPLLSCFAEDPGLADLVALYAAEMPERVKTLADRFAARDWPGLTVCAHQLKGSAGSHGFHQLTPYAAALEHASRERLGEAAIQQALAALVELCRRIAVSAAPSGATSANRAPGCSPAR